MRQARRMFYKAGFRPKPGSVLFSPSNAFLYGVRDAMNRKHKETK